MVRWSRIVAHFVLIITVFMIVLPVGTAQAQPLKRWCKDMGGVQVGNTCTLPEGNVAKVVKSLDVAPGQILINKGTINNNGTIGTSGTIHNEGTGTINNNGKINNNGTIYNDGTINNGTINNNGTIKNCGTISDSLIIGNTPEACPS